MGPTGDQSCLAIDIGGTKLAAAMVDGAGRVRHRRQVPTPGPPADAEAVFGALGGLIDEVRGAVTDRDQAAAVCGVGCGGPMRSGGSTVSPLNIPAWRDFPLRDRLAEAVGLPTFVDNDAKALALGEGWVGAARGSENYLAMVVSTGVGGGIVLDGRLLEGEQGNAGHIGHITVEPEGHPCRCGSRGCLEAEASGTAIAEITGRPAADADAATIERTGRLVGRAVASVATLLDLRLTVVAGSVALGFGAPFFAAAQAEIERRARLDYVRGASIGPGGLGADGPIVGAAALGWAGLAGRAG